MGARVYVYALMGAPLRRRTIEGRPVETLAVGGLFAAIERRARPPATTERALRKQHAIVVALALAVDAILPVRFGTFVSVSALEETVRERRAPLGAALRKVRRRVQMTFRVLGQAPLRVPAAEPATGRDYLLARAASAHPPLPPDVDNLRGLLRPLAVAERIEHGRGAVYASVHHLVHRGRVDRYRERFESAMVGLEPPSQVMLSGPWPPFAFAPDIWD